MSNTIQEIKVPVEANGHRVVVGVWPTKRKAGMAFVDFRRNDTNADFVRRLQGTEIFSTLTLTTERAHNYFFKRTVDSQEDAETFIQEMEAYMLDFLSQQEVREKPARVRKAKVAETVEEVIEETVQETVTETVIETVFEEVGSEQEMVA